MNKCKICGNEFTGRYCNICGNEYKEDEKLICPECGTEVVTGSAFCNMCGSPIQKIEETIISDTYENIYYKQQIYDESQNNAPKATQENEEENIQSYSKTENTYFASFNIDNKVIAKWVLYGLNWTLFVVIACMLIFGKALYPSEKIYRKNYMDYKYDGYTSRMDMGITLYNFSKGILDSKKSSDNVTPLSNTTEALVIFGVIFAISIIIYGYALVKGRKSCMTVAKGGIFFACMAIAIAGWSFFVCHEYNKEYGNRMSVTPIMIAVIVMALVKLTILIPQYIKVCNKIYDNVK